MPPKKCAKCGQEYSLSRQDQLLRSLVGVNARLFPAIKAATDRAKDYCNDCWKAEVKPVAKGMVAAMDKEDQEGGH